MWNFQVTARTRLYVCVELVGEDKVLLICTWRNEGRKCFNVEQSRRLFVAVVTLTKDDAGLFCLAVTYEQWDEMAGCCSHLSQRSFLDWNITKATYRSNSKPAVIAQQANGSWWEEDTGRSENHDHPFIGRRWAWCIYTHMFQSYLLNPSLNIRIFIYPEDGRIRLLWNVCSRLHAITTGFMS
jgi:hypothetical protein